MNNEHEDREITTEERIIEEQAVAELKRKVIIDAGGVPAE